MKLHFMLFEEKNTNYGTREFKCWDFEDYENAIKFSENRIKVAKSEHEDISVVSDGKWIQISIDGTMEKNVVLDYSSKMIVSRNYRIVPVEFIEKF